MIDKINRLKVLIDKYRENLKQYQTASYNETEVRNDFVNPFFELLGWDINNNSGLPQHLREVKHEATVIVEQDGVKRKKKPDYSFRISGNTKFFIETKKPSVDIGTNKEAVFQLRRYGWNGNLKISILTNFNDLIIYDCTIIPSENDNVNLGVIAKYNFEEYVENFEDIYKMLSKESAINGEFDSIFDKVSTSYKKEPFDSYFLKQIKKWRNSLAEDILANSRQINELELNIFVQKLMNRILFLRICEDRNIEDYETIKNIKSYQELKKLFIKADKKYDSGLFDLIDEEFIVVSDNILIEIFLELYYPNSVYEFGVVDAYIIGRIYELFLEEEIKIMNNKVVIEKKPEVVESQGIVNTPKYISDVIVKETLDPLFNEKTFEEINNIRVADICCGSGIFLLSAYEYIMNVYINKFVKEQEDDAIRNGYIFKTNINGNYILSLEIKKRILENNLFGVDIDTLAVEVAKFGLLVKLIEDCTKEEIESFIIDNKGGILPKIDDNIKNGNSLVDSSYTDFNEKFALNFELLDKIKIFDWDKEFFNTFDGNKFDAIIGNPPYIRVQNLAKYSSEEYEFYRSSKSPYITSKAELLDKYYLFVERALTLVKNSGYVGYIIPHKFMLIETGTNLRKVISNNKCVKKIIHFKSNQVFKGKSTYTCIIILSKNKHKNFEIGFVDKLSEFIYNHYVDLKEYNIDFLTEKPWVFMSDEIVKSLDKIKRKCKPLNNFADIFVGLQTSNDSIYIIKKENSDKNYIYFKDFKGIARKVEKTILKKCIYDVKLEKYKEVISNRYIIYPYEVVNNRARVYNIKDIRERYPECFKYLCDYREILDKRSIRNRDETNWHQFGRSQSLTKFTGKQHLIWPVLSTESNYVYDNEGITFTGGGNGPYYGLEMKAGIEESIFYIQAVLNHDFIEAIVKNKASTFRGDYYSHGKQFIQDLPVRKIDFSNKIEKELHDNIVNHVNNIMIMYKRVNTLNSQFTKIPIIRAIEVEKEKIRQSINTLYEV